MNHSETELVERLIDLKENYFVSGVKAEFEDEGAKAEELDFLKKLADEANLELSLKIGGCGAVKDLYEAKNIGVQTIVAPMIESVYALKKYQRAINSVFTKQEKEKIKFYINIETVNGLKYLDEILNSEYLADIDGIVLGRTDLAESMNMNAKDVDSGKILDTAQKTAITVNEYNKEFIIGGGISPLSVRFLKNLPQNTLDKYETRKIIFNAKDSLNAPNTEEGIIKALEFELMWIKSKKNPHAITAYDSERINILESRLLCRSR